MCVPNPFTQWVSTFCNVPMAMNVQEHLDAMCDTYASITQEISLRVGCACASYTHSQLLLSTNGHCFLKRWGLHPN